MFSGPSYWSGSQNGCTGDDFLITSDADYWESSSSYFVSSEPWYVSFTYTGSGTVRIGDIGSDNDQYYTSSQVAAELDSGGDLSGQLVVYAPSFSGTITNLCITNVAGSCEGSSPPPSSSYSELSSTNPFTEVFNQALNGSSTEVVSIVDNPTEDYFDGVLLFFISMFGVYWMFSKRT